MELRGWEELDVVLVSGDAYVDHPSFGTAVVGRILEKAGLRVAIIAQPNWRDDLRDFRKFGKPRLFFGVSAGAMDSMVNHYTAQRRRRADDAYTPGGKAGFRPDYAVTVYSRILKQLFPETPIVLGGIEASLRRVSHYDYWSDTLKPSVLAESGADLLLYGMGEKTLLELVRLLKKGVPFSSLRNLFQTAFLQDFARPLPMVHNWDTIELAPHELCQENLHVQARNFRVVENESNRWQARRLTQAVQGKMLVINPPHPPPQIGEIDQAFDLPFTRIPHPRYRDRGPIPAWEMVKHSITLHRGCFGGCSFCTISAHQGKFIANRSRESIRRELQSLLAMPGFDGTITDLGGPSANMYSMQGVNLEKCQKCERPSCIFPTICSNLNTSHQDLLDIYREVRQQKGVRHAFVGSGIRYDLLLAPEGKSLRTDQVDYIRELAAHHVSGRLKVAPEHTAPAVLKLMRKPPFMLFRTFRELFIQASARAGKPLQLIIPYFISSHPGSRLEDMADLAEQTAELGYRLEQVQDFTPTPMTMSSEIHYCGVHPVSLRPVHVVREDQDKRDQRRFFFWYLPEHRDWIKQSLQKLGTNSKLLRYLGKKRM